MSKDVLISIRPRWVEKICHRIGEENGKPIYEKKIEARKTKPAIPTPFKCFIYETKGKQVEHCDGCDVTYYGRGKVIGEFVCDSIEMVNAKCSDYGIDLFYHDCMSQGCLTEREIEKYFNIPKDKDLRVMKGNGYAWHISDLKIFDKPKELSEFEFPKDNIYLSYRKRNQYFKGITRPPQSWCYVEADK